MEPDPDIKKPSQHSDRSQVESDAIIRLHESYLTSRYPEGTFEEFRADHTNQELVAALLADPKKFGAERIRAALPLLSRDFRDLGGQLTLSRVDFEESDPSSPLTIGYRLGVLSSSYDESVLFQVTLSESYLRVPADFVLESQHIEDLEKRSLSACPVVVREGEHVQIARDAFEKLDVQFGIWSEIYGTYQFTYQDTLTLARNARAFSPPALSNQLVLQTESSILQYALHQLYHPSTLVTLPEHATDPREFQLDMSEDKLMKLTNRTATPLALRFRLLKDEK